MLSTVRNGVRRTAWSSLKFSWVSASQQKKNTALRNVTAKANQTPARADVSVRLWSYL